MPVFLTRDNACCVCGRRDRVSERIESRDWGYRTTDEKIVYLRCGRCNHLFLDRIPGSAADIAALYPPEYGAYSRSSFGFFGMAARRFAASLKASSIKRLGRRIAAATEFGPGANALVSREWLPPDCDISYVDVHPSDQLPRDARTIRAAAEDGVGLIPGDQGLIVANQLVEHLAEPRRFLEACRDKLAPGGVLFVETPCLDGWDARLFMRDGTWGGLHAPRHFQIFSRASLRELVVQAGYKIHSFEPILSPFLWSESACHYLLKRGWRHVGWARLSNPAALAAFCALDMLRVPLRRPTSNMRVIATRA